MGCESPLSLWTQTKATCQASFKAQVDFRLKLSQCERVIWSSILGCSQRFLLCRIKYLDSQKQELSTFLQVACQRPPSTVASLVRPSRASSASSSGTWGSATGSGTRTATPWSDSPKPSSRRSGRWPSPRSSATTATRWVATSMERNLFVGQRL